MKIKFGIPNKYNKNNRYQAHTIYKNCSWKQNYTPLTNVK